MELVPRNRTPALLAFSTMIFFSSGTPFFFASELM
jgi:hypothetical protein